MEKSNASGVANAHEKGRTASVGSGPLFGVLGLDESYAPLESALREAETHKSGARLADYATEITDAIRRARRMDWWVKNATDISRERGDLFRAGEAMRQALFECKRGVDECAAWNAAAQPIREMKEWMTSPNIQGQTRSADDAKA